MMSNKSGRFVSSRKGTPRNDGRPGIFTDEDPERVLNEIETLRDRLSKSLLSGGEQFL